MVILVNKKGYTVFELIIVMLVLGVVTALFIGTTSYAFKDNTEEYYTVRKSNIESNAKRYQELIDELFNKDEQKKVLKKQENY